MNIDSIVHNIILAYLVGGLVMGIWAAAAVLIDKPEFRNWHLVYRLPFGVAFITLAGGIIVLMAASSAVTKARKGGGL